VGIFDFLMRVRAEKCLNLGGTGSQPVESGNLPDSRDLPDSASNGTPKDSGW